MKRFSVLPVTLYRFQAHKRPKLRQQQAQFEQGQTSYDFIIGQKNLYHPVKGDKFEKPNGLSLRPLGVNLAELLGSWSPNVIYELPANLTIPDHFVLYLERSDHYSLQTKQPIRPDDFELKAMKFFESLKQITVDEMKKRVIQSLKK